jgi:GT2 family glycosyltransferase
LLAGEERLFNGMGRSTDGVSGVKRSERPRTDGKEAGASAPDGTASKRSTRSSKTKKSASRQRSTRSASVDRNGGKGDARKEELTELLGAAQEKGSGGQQQDLPAVLSQVVGALLDDERVQSALYDARLLVTALQQASFAAAAQTGPAAQPAVVEDDEEDLAERRTDLGYQAVVRRIRDLVREIVPEDGVIAVVSKGDESLLDLYGREAWHFPQEVNGDYAPQYPNGATTMIAHLEMLRAEGAEYLLIPKPMSGWFGGHPKFNQHVRRHYPVAVEQEDACTIFELEKSSTAGVNLWWTHLSELISEHRDRFERDPAILDWHTRMEIKEHFPDETVFQPPWGDETELPYFDRSVDIVLVSTPDDASLNEARRVANYAVAILNPAEGAAPLDASLDYSEEDLVMSIDYVGEQQQHVAQSTSIVIPTCDGHDQLAKCLKALDETLPNPFRGEVIVVDDASTPKVERELSALLRGSRLQIKVVRNEKNLGFVSSCNHGARAASGDILVFLNDDTLPQHGWLPPMLQLFHDREDAGAVGGRLIYPDGSLQEAGNVIFSNGTGANFGRNDHVDAPLYKYVREVDYCSGALLATPRELFIELGGFDERYRPAYYEDTDYCFTLRDHGKRVYYQPETVVVHVEGATSGTDETAGIKRYQSVNRSKFVEKWGSALEHQPTAPGDYSPRTWHLLAVRRDAG